MIRSGTNRVGVGPREYRKAKSLGFISVCAACERLAAALRPYDPDIDPEREHVPGCGLVLGEECGSPAHDMDFPEYGGPFDDKWIRENCCVCGKPANTIVTVIKDGVPLEYPVGYCSDHIHEARVQAERRRVLTGKHNMWRRVDVILS